MLRLKTAWFSTLLSKITFKLPHKKIQNLKISKFWLPLPKSKKRTSNLAIKCQTNSVKLWLLPAHRKTLALPICRLNTMNCIIATFRHSQKVNSKLKSLMIMNPKVEVILLLSNKLRIMLLLLSRWFNRMQRLNKPLLQGLKLLLQRPLLLNQGKPNKLQPLMIKMQQLPNCKLRLLSLISKFQS